MKLSSANSSSLEESKICCLVKTMYRYCTGVEYIYSGVVRESVWNMAMMGPNLSMVGGPLGQSGQNVPGHVGVELSPGRGNVHTHCE